MKNQIAILFIIMTSLTTYGQFSKTELLGEWICENKDSSYYKSKYVTFYSDSTFKHESNRCDFVEWTIETDRFFIVNVNKCLNTLSTKLLRPDIELKKYRWKRIIELVRGDRVCDKFKIVEFSEQRSDNNSRAIKILKLKRVSKSISDNKFGD
jgi:hypothetical protein